MRKNTRLAVINDPAASLEAKMVAEEHLRHERRLAEIKAGSKRLALLEPFASALEAAKTPLSLSSIYIGSEVLFVGAGGLTTWDLSRYKTLLSLGFTQIDAKVYGRTTDVTLKKGRLKLRMSLPSDFKDTGIV